MKFKQAMILSKIGVKVRCTLWYEEAWILNIHEGKPRNIERSKYYGTDEEGNVYNIVETDLSEEWEYFNDKETDTNLSGSGA